MTARCTGTPKFQSFAPLFQPTVLVSQGQGGGTTKGGGVSLIGAGISKFCGGEGLGKWLLESGGSLAYHSSPKGIPKKKSRTIIHQKLVQ